MAPIPKQATSQTVEMIYASYRQNNGDGKRPHLGASLIGKECERALWYDFRWCTPPQFDGRMLRLFETGQLEETRFVKNLRRIGALVLDVNPESGRQWHVSTLGGHFSGSLDALAVGIPEAPRTWHVVEMKTHNAKSFNELKNKGVMESKPQHYAQMQIYMYLIKVTRALYLAVCKDTDELYSERVRIDEKFAQLLIDKAARIINSERVPTGISTDATWYQCRMCSHAAICHEGQFAERHCRTCIHSTPVENAQWDCSMSDQVLTFEQQKTGCVEHRYIPDLVPGEQVDVDETNGWIKYVKKDGEIWWDGVKS